MAVLLGEKLPSRPPRVYLNHKKTYPIQGLRSQLDRIVLALYELRPILLPCCQRRAAGWEISVLPDGVDLLCAYFKTACCNKATGHRWYSSW